MGQVCLACSHPKRAEIDRALAVPGAVKTQIGAKYSLKPSCICKHAREHLPATVVKAAEAAEVCRADDLLTQIVEHRDRAVWFVVEAQIIAKEAKESKDTATAIEAIKSVAGPLREAKGALELLGEVTGQLQRKGQINVDARSVQVMADREVLEQMRAEIDRRLK
jgi:hypothetical protein